MFFSFSRSAISVWLRAMRSGPCASGSHSACAGCEARGFKRTQAPAQFRVLGLDLDLASPQVFDQLLRLLGPRNLRV